MAINLILIPCLSGAKWEKRQYSQLARSYHVVAPSLPDGPGKIEDYISYIEQLVNLRDPFVLIGDSFGASIALGLAAKQPRNLRALIISGGFAKNPINDPITKLKLLVGLHLPTALYRPVTLQLHSHALRSENDQKGTVPWSANDTYQLFLRHTSRTAYSTRSRAALATDYSSILSDISVPTLILTPSEDTLIGKDAAKLTQDRIPHAIEVIIPNSGHMFRFSHPDAYQAAILSFLEDNHVTS